MSHLAEIAQRALEMGGLYGRERSVLKHIAECRTAEMGGNALFCECGNWDVHYNSCRDRHCPLCQGAARARWVNERLGELLPCSYFHVVFTVPHELVRLALANRRLFYDALFISVHATLLAVCANGENLGGRVGGLSILHTWNQKLAFHPHLHCIVPGGGISLDGEQWIAGNPTYLVSVKRLSAVFRGKFLSMLSEACDAGRLYGDKPTLRDALRKAADKAFVVYAKPPFGGPAQVVKYLGRYTHRVGISEQRIVSQNAHQVSFSWIDRAHAHARKVMTIPHADFIRKFLLHLLPKGLRKIRYFGYMGNRDRTASIELVRTLIKQSGADYASGETGQSVESIPETTTPICSKCGRTMHVYQTFGRSSAARRLEFRLARIRWMQASDKLRTG
jgi:hypothetical protein